ENRMKVVDTSSPDGITSLGEEYSPLELAFVLNHDVKHEGESRVGDPTEIALVNHFLASSSPEQFQEVQSRFPRIQEIPFDSDRKMMTTAHQFGNRVLIL